MFDFCWNNAVFCPEERVALRPQSVGFYLLHARLRWRNRNPRQRRLEWRRNPRLKTFTKNQCESRNGSLAHPAETSVHCKAELASHSYNNDAKAAQPQEFIDPVHIGHANCFINQCSGEAVRQCWHVISGRMFVTDIHWPLLGRSWNICSKEEIFCHVCVYWIGINFCFTSPFIVYCIGYNSFFH